MNDSTYLMMIYFSKKNSKRQERQHNKVNFNKKIFIEEKIKKPENNQNELKGILKNKKWLFIF